MRIVEPGKERRVRRPGIGCLVVGGQAVVFLLIWRVDAIGHFVEGLGHFHFHMVFGTLLTLGPPGLRFLVDGFSQKDRQLREAWRVRVGRGQWRCGGGCGGV